MSRKVAKLRNKAKALKAAIQKEIDDLKDALFRRASRRVIDGEIRAFRVSLQSDRDIDFESWRARLFVPVTATASDGSEVILGQARLEGTPDAPTAIVNVDSQRWTEVVGDPDCPCAAYAGPYKILMGV